VLPILHLNGYKIANPTCWPHRRRTAQPDARLRPRTRTSSRQRAEDHTSAPPSPALLDDRARRDRRDPTTASRPSAPRPTPRPRWPMIVFRHPKAGPDRPTVDGLKWTGIVACPPGAHWPDFREHPGHLQVLEDWLAQLPRRANCSTTAVACAPTWPPRPAPGTCAWAPTRTPTAGLLQGRCACPTFRDYGVDVPAPGRHRRRSHPVLGPLAHRRDAAQPGATSASSARRDRLQPAGRRLEVTGKPGWPSFSARSTTHLARRPGDGVLSEHQCQGWLEGYLLTGRHGLFNCYEAFIHIIDSMFNQHAKWLKGHREIPWRRPIAS
jgi:xylulose-5-phosphate/fructose-6-phosphate phosphoketolase